MIALSAISILISSVIGFLLVSLCWPNRDHFLIRVSLGIGIGHGVTSLLFFVWLLTYGQADKKYIAVDVLILALLLVLFVLDGRRKKGASVNADLLPKTTGTLRYSRLLTGAFILVLLSTLTSIVVSIFREPHGNGWDAWAIYGVRARAIFRGGAQWRDAFSPLIPWSHTDYPLLLPISTARIWLYTGGEIAWAQSLLTAVITIATVGLVWSGLRALRSPMQANLGAILLLSSTTFVTYGASAYADVPLMFFFAAVFVLLALSRQLQANNNFLILAGLAAGLAAWTKNEGLLFVVCFLLAHAVFSLKENGWRSCLRQLIRISVGLLPALVIALYFKRQLAPASELLAAMGGGSVIRKVLDYHRHIIIAKSLWREIVYYCGRGINVAWLLVIYMVAIGSRGSKTALQLGLILALMFVGCYWVYLTTPYDLAFHVSTSIQRLLLQHYPGFLLLFFLVTLTPEESLARQEQGV